MELNEFLDTMKEDIELNTISSKTRIRLYNTLIDKKFDTIALTAELQLLHDYNLRNREIHAFDEVLFDPTNGLSEGEIHSMRQSRYTKCSELGVIFNQLHPTTRIITGYYIGK